MWYNGTMNKKTRNKVAKHFGDGGYFNKKTKIPLSDIMKASRIMGDMNSERFWNSIIKDKMDRERK